MTTLLHEVVHDSVFQLHRSRAWERVLGLAYAITSGISASQFTRWHLDHHDNLGDDEDDPKRHWLSPKRNARWYKLLYCTPVLMPLYFRAAAREAASLSRRAAPPHHARAAGDHGASSSRSMAALFYFGGFARMARVQLVPYFLVFPVAFTLNRLGQHYNIDPTHPLKWSTLMKPSRFWDFLFLYSNYHLEHHYFPRVPFYNLRKAAHAAAPALRGAGAEAAHVPRDRLAVVRAEPRAAHELGDRSRADRTRRSRWGSSRDDDSLDDSSSSSQSGSANPPAAQVAARVAIR